MKKAYLLLALLSLAMFSPFRIRAQDKPDQLRTMSHDELDVVKVVLAQERAWNKGDLDGYLAEYQNSPDLLFLGGHVTRGFAEMQSDYRHAYPTRESMGTLSFSEIEPHVLSEKIAVIVGKYHLERTKKAGGSADGFFSLVLEKTGEGWKIVVDHSS